LVAAFRLSKVSSGYVRVRYGGISQILQLYRKSQYPTLIVSTKGRLMPVHKYCMRVCWTVTNALAYNTLVLKGLELLSMLGTPKYAMSPFLYYCYKTFPAT